jgi:hypothetical protein
MKDRGCLVNTPSILRYISYKLWEESKGTFHWYNSNCKIRLEAESILRCKKDKKRNLCTVRTQANSCNMSHWRHKFLPDKFGDKSSKRRKGGKHSSTKDKGLIPSKIGKGMNNLNMYYQAHRLDEGSWLHMTHPRGMIGCKSGKDWQISTKNSRHRREDKSWVEFGCSMTRKWKADRRVNSCHCDWQADTRRKMCRYQPKDTCSRAECRDCKYLFTQK